MLRFSVSEYVGCTSRSSTRNQNAQFPSCCVMAQFAHSRRNRTSDGSKLGFLKIDQKCLYSGGVCVAYISSCVCIVYMNVRKQRMLSKEKFCVCILLFQ